MENTEKNKLRNIVRDQVRKQTKLDQRNEIKRFVSSLLQSEKDDISLDVKVALELDAQYAFDRFLELRSK